MLQVLTDILFTNKKICIMDKVLEVEKFSSNDYWFSAQQLAKFVNTNKISKDQILKITSVTRDNVLILFYYKSA